MPCNTKAPTIRWFYLTIGILSMLFAGILYSWSILKAPLADAFGWNASQLTMNFTLTMCFFCLGGVGGGLLARRLGTRLTIALGGALACIGFVLTARLDGSSLPMLYLSYGVITATGIGFAYNVVLSTVQAWFPDKKGTCSGALLMGFGASSLVLGSLADALIQNPAVGWRAAFLCLGVAIGIVLVTAALLIRLPAPGTVLPQPKAAANRVQEDFEAADYTTGQMLRRFTFWRAFLCIIFLAAMGNTVISFAKDLSLSVGASAALSTTLVGVLAVCNGLGRILTGRPLRHPGPPPHHAAGQRCRHPGRPGHAAVRGRPLRPPVRGRPVHHRHLLRCLPHHLLRLYLLLLRRQVLLPQLLRHELQPDRRLLRCHRRQRPAHPNRGYAAPLVLLLVLAVAALALNLSIKRP